MLPMDAIVPYVGWTVVIVVVALVAVYLKNHGIFVRRVKHGKTEVNLDFEDTKEEEQSAEDHKGQNEGGNVDRRELLRVFRIFLGSPSGLETYREAFCDMVDHFNTTHAEIRNVTFRVEKWEDIPTAYGRPQSTINEKLATCVGYVLLLYDRWGSPPGESDGSNFSSGNAEEFRIAQGMIKTNQMQKIGVYFKSVPLARLQSPDEQLAKVLEFSQWLQDNHVLLYSEFSDEVEFRKKIDRFLAEWLGEIAPWPKPEGVKTVFDYERFLGEQGQQ